jgi:hypothetical protein
MTAVAPLSCEHRSPGSVLLLKPRRAAELCKLLKIHVEDTQSEYTIGGIAVYVG